MHSQRSQAGGSQRRDKRSSRPRHWGRGRTVAWTKPQLRREETSDGVALLFLNIAGSLTAVNHCLVLLLIKWVLLYWHDPATSLTSRDPVICAHFSVFPPNCFFPQRCLTGVAPLLMKAFRGQWSELCRDPSGTRFIHL